MFVLAFEGTSPFRLLLVREMGRTYKIVELEKTLTEILNVTSCLDNYTTNPFGAMSAILKMACEALDHPGECVCGEERKR